MEKIANWNKTISSLPGAHLFQTQEWAELKSRYGWENHQVILESHGLIDAAALVLSRGVRFTRLLPEFKVLYSPRGPLTDWSDLEKFEKILHEMEEMCRKQDAIFIKIDPEIIQSINEEELNPAWNQIIYILKKRRWRYSPEQIQFKNTVWIDLAKTEDLLLAGMKQKTRYNIRLAEKKGVKIRIGDEKDLKRLFQIYAETSLRDGFAIRSKEYYLDLWRLFIQKSMAYPLIAECEGEVIAGLFLFIFAGKAWYLYGMSTNHHREKMPNYLLQWEAIKLAKSKNVQTYDLWGAPDSLSPDDRMWGVYRFKEGLGGKLVKTLGAWDYTEKPFVYQMYSKVMPRVLRLMRWRGKGKTVSESGL